MVDVDATAGALIRRAVEISRVRGSVERLSGPVRTGAEEAIGSVNASMAMQVSALRRYAGHVCKLDDQLHDSASAAAAGPVFDEIRGLMASTVEDELGTPRLADAVELTKAASDAIAATVQEAAADLRLLRGTSMPSMPMFD